MKREFKQIKIIFKAAIVMSIGLLLFKWLPMTIWGRDILFDASMHITVAIFILYIIWFFIDQNRKWHVPYLALSVLVLAVVSFQRIEANAHNDIGLLAGLIISLVAIIYSQFDYFKKNIKF